MNGMVSPMTFGRDPEGSPTKIAFVSRSIAVAVFWAAENVPRPMITYRQPRWLIFVQPIRLCSSGWTR